MHLLVDGDYLLSGFRPTSEEEVKAAVDRLMTAIEQQLLLPAGADTAVTTLVSRIIFFSSALIKGLEEGPRTCVISTLRRLRFQTHVLESIHGRAGTPVDAALCTKMLQLSLLPAGGGVSGSNSAVPSHGHAAHAFCLVTPNAYLSTAMELMASRECGEIVFAVYEGDEVAEELLGYASARYGAAGGVATMAKHDGVTFLPSTEAAVAALALVQQQEQGNLSVSALAELKSLQVRLQQRKSTTGAGATVVMPKAPAATAVAPPPLPTVSNLFAPPSGPQTTVATAPPSSPASRRSSSASSRDNGDGAKHTLPQGPPPVLAMAKPLDRVNVPAPPSFFETGSLHTVTTATSPLTVVQHASPPSAMPPLSSTSPLSATNGVAGAATSIGEPMVSTTLPVEWGLVYDAAQQRHYYAHTDATGRTRSTWQHPLGPQKQLELEEQVQTWRAARLHSPHSTQLQPSSALPDGWEERTDPQTRRTFYVDHKSKTTSWERPQPTVANVSSHASGSGAMALSPPWEARVDPSTGRTFYVNHETKTTSWEPPAVARSTCGTESLSQHAFYANDKTRQTSWNGPRSAVPTLPAPWEARVDPSTGRTFYVNHETKTTSWERPLV
ncbi:WW domain containing protein, putative [Leishmania lindenbergi]|uniref:WW domain containing protein n=1 Tax=Leishmania lindenbergi TaxID=651832 RepID=A0AAW3AN32_9TRYP